MRAAEALKLKRGDRVIRFNPVTKVSNTLRVMHCSQVGSDIELSLEVERGAYVVLDREGVLEQVSALKRTDDKKQNSLF